MARDPNYLITKAKALFGAIGLFLVLSACSSENLNGRFGRKNLLSGQILPLVSDVESSKVRALSCTSAIVKLYSLDEDGNKASKSIGEGKIDPSGAYSLSYAGAVLSLDKAYLVEVEGCSESLARPVTGATKQDISFSSTLLSLLGQNGYAAQLTQKQAKKIEALLTSSSTDQINYESAYQTWFTKYSNEFQSLFGSSPTVLEDIPPEIEIINGPIVIDEKVSQSYSVITKHWSTNYIAAYKWRFEGDSPVSGSNVTIRPNANMQGQRALTLSYGKKQNAGTLLDESKPYKQKVLAITVNNTYPAQLPLISLDSQSITNDSLVNLSFDSGIAGINCETFSEVAVIQDSFAAQYDNSLYSPIDCSSGGTLSVTKLLVGQGPHILYVWVKDLSGNISNVSQFNIPQSINVTLDSVRPVIGGLTPVSNTVQNRSFIVTGTCEADHSHALVAAHGENVVISEVIAGIPTTLAQPICSNTGTFSASVTVSTGDGIKNLSISQKDKGQSLANGQNTSDLQLLNIITDTVPPATLTINTVLTNNPFISTVAVEGDCTVGGDAEAVVRISEGSLSPSASQNANCVNNAGVGRFSAMLSFATDGSKTLVATQKDLVGNAVTANIVVVKDSVAPTLAFSGPAANSFFQSNFTLTGICEAGLSNITLAATAPATVSPSSITRSGGGTFSQLATVSASDGAVVLSISLTDLAGNTTDRTLSLTKDATAPQITSGGFTLPLGLLTSSNFIKLNFSATDALSPIKYICFI